MHVVNPDAECCPVAHASHWVLAVSPITSEYVPARHGEQTEEEEEAKVPTGQSSPHSKAPK